MTRNSYVQLEIVNLYDLQVKKYGSLNCVLNTFRVKFNLFFMFRHFSLVIENRTGIKE